MHDPIEHLLLEFFFDSFQLKCSAGSLCSFQLCHSAKITWSYIYFRPRKLTSSPIPAFAHKLIEAAFLDYARLLRSLGLREGAALWASRAGTAGEQLLEELFQGEGCSPESVFGKEQAELVQGSTEWPQRQRSCAVVKSETCLFSLNVVRLQEFSLSVTVKSPVRHWRLFVLVAVFDISDLCVSICVCIHTCMHACISFITSLMYPISEVMKC